MNVILKETISPHEYIVEIGKQEVGLCTLLQDGQWRVTIYSDQILGLKSIRVSPYSVDGFGKTQINALLNAVSIIRKETARRNDVLKWLEIKIGTTNMTEDELQKERTTGTL